MEDTAFFMEDTVFWNTCVRRTHNFQNIFLSLADSTICADMCRQHYLHEQRVIITCADSNTYMCRDRCLHVQRPVLTCADSSIYMSGASGPDWILCQKCSLGILLWISVGKRVKRTRAWSNPFQAERVMVPLTIKFFFRKLLDLFNSSVF